MSTVSEQDLSDLMKAIDPPIPNHPDLFVQVANHVQRRRRLRQGLGSGLLVMILTSTGYGFWTAHSQSTKVNVVEAAAPTSCARQASVAPTKTEQSDKNQVVVPGQPLRALICRYGGTAEQHSLLNGEARIEGAKMPSLVASLNSAKAITARVLYCPQDDGAHYEIIFSYADRKDLKVLVYLRGCKLTLNGAGIQYLTSDATLSLLSDALRNN